MFQFAKQLKGLFVNSANLVGARDFIYGEVNGVPSKLALSAGGPPFASGGSIVSGVSSYVTMVETGNSVVSRTILTLTDLPQAVVNGTEYQGTEIWNFPEGRILVMGCIGTLAQKTTSILANTLNTGSTGSLALGSVVASNTTLSSTMVDLMPATAFTSSSTINVAGTAVSAPLAASAQFDGHTTATKMFLNSAYATTGDVDADATQTWTGTIQIVWAKIGDY